MATRKSPKELMAARNPLTRTSVMPVDIYSQAPQPPVIVAESEQEQKGHTAEQAKKQIPERKARKAPEAKNVITKSEAIVSYSTYLSPKRIKKIKWRALERDMKDYQIVQEAIDEFFERHPKA